MVDGVTFFIQQRMPASISENIVYIKERSKYIAYRTSLICLYVYYPIFQIRKSRHTEIL